MATPAAPTPTHPFDQAPTSPRKLPKPLKPRKVEKRHRGRKG
jgi:hypothetical protein